MHAVKPQKYLFLCPLTPFPVSPATPLASQKRLEPEHAESPISSGNSIGYADQHFPQTQHVCDAKTHVGFLIHELFTHRTS